MEKAGFTNVQADDRTDLFVGCLESELKKTEGMRDEFIKVGQTMSSVMFCLLIRKILTFIFFVSFYSFSMVMRKKKYLITQMQIA